MGKLDLLKYWICNDENIYRIYEIIKIWSKKWYEIKIIWYEFFYFINPISLMASVWYYFSLNRFWCPNHPDTRLEGVWGDDWEVVQRSWRRGYFWLWTGMWCEYIRIYMYSINLLFLCSFFTLIFKKCWEKTGKQKIKKIK